MNVLFAASEAAPFAKAGGLGDVVGSLPLALTKAGVSCAVIMPRFRSCRSFDAEFLGHKDIVLGWRRQYAGLYRCVHEGVPFFFVDNEYYFGGANIYGYAEGEAEKYAFFCKAVLELLPLTGFCPDVLHCNDWQTGLLPVLLKTQYTHLSVATVFTIHNLKYQGTYGFQLFKDLLDFPDELFTTEQLEFYGGASFLKGGLLYADKVTTVSPTYREETLLPEYGENMQGVLNVRRNDYSGILNGIGEHFDPQTDKNLPYHFSAENLRNKSRCKAALQKELGLKEESDVPLIAMVTRLYDQKGLELICDRMRELLFTQKFQFALLGSGDRGYEDFFRSVSEAFPGRVAVRIGYDAALAQRLYGGSDLFLMPSRYEPCGLSQLIAMRYGTLPIVRRTGGLADTVVDVSDGGYGFCFDEYNAYFMAEQIVRALVFCRDRRALSAARKRAMRADFLWHRSAESYKALYREVCSLNEQIQKKGV